MKTLTSFLRPAAWLALVPAALAFTSCSDDDNDTATPDQAKVLVSHAAASATAKVKVLADDRELAQVDYGQSSGYVNALAGARTIRINDASTNQTNVTKSNISFDKDKNYSVFAYSPSTSLGSADAIVVTDDLTAPTAGKAKIRIVHLGVNAPSPVKLSQPVSVGTVDIVPSVAFGAASAFVEIEPGTYNLAVVSGSGLTATTEASVGDGSGSGSGNKTYAAGKIYTVVLRGIKSTSVAQDQRLKAVLIENK